MAVSAPYTRLAAMAAAVLCLATLGACVEIDERPAEWSYIHAAIIKPNCTSSNCHTDISRAAGISFDDRLEGYEFLTGFGCGQSGAGDFVVPNEPEISKLMYLVRGEEVRTMPPDVPLTESEVDLIERWIVEGAPCNP